VSSDRHRRQLGSCLWLIDRLALCLGSTGAAGAAQAGAFGAAMLQAGHMHILGSRGIVLDFPGKDGVRYRRSMVPAWRCC
jgi:hypothetical protein